MTKHPLPPRNERSKWGVQLSIEIFLQVPGNRDGLLFISACDIYWWGIVLKRRIFPGMSGMIRVNLLKPVSSYFSCHFPTVMLLPKWSLFILLASLFLLFVRQSGLFTSAVKCFVKDRSGDSREKFATSTRMSARIYPESKLQVS